MLKCLEIFITFSINTQLFVLVGNQNANVWYEIRIFEEVAAQHPDISEFSYTLSTIDNSILNSDSLSIVTYLLLIKSS